MMVDKTVDKYIGESSLSRVYKHSQDHDIGTITAFRDEHTKRENLQRNKSLKTNLAKNRFGLTIVKGSYIENYGTKDEKEVGEQVFLVVDLEDKGNLKRILRELGEKFDQDSILYIPKGGQEGHLIGTSKRDNSYPGYNKTVKLKNAVFGQSGEFMTRVNGRPFVLKESVEYVGPPDSRMSRWACHVMAGKPWKEMELGDETGDDQEG